METAIVSLICVALMILGGMTMANNLLSTADTTTAGLEEMNETAGEIMRTELSILSTDHSGNTLEVILENSGQTKIADFSRWDFIVQYEDNQNEYQVVRINYDEDGAPPANDTWVEEGIYLDAAGAQDEVFEPGILNPGEEIILQAKIVTPPVGGGTTNLVVVSTPNGIPVSSVFSG